MLCNYSDITVRLGEPIWWDEVGCPRYEKFKPDRVNDIYARDVILLEIACQDCGNRMLVAMSSGGLAHVERLWEIRKDIENKTIHYGDPPCFSCSAGATMNCIDLRVVEYWRHHNFEWIRDPKLEVTLEDEDER